MHPFESLLSCWCHPRLVPENLAAVSVGLFLATVMALLLDDASL
jgi:hypothetical protein